ncbi:MAG: S8 family serine peptidase [Clostridia bacterium]|nr:S8 family serine peptidase [Clostridia bacterium]
MKKFIIFCLTFLALIITANAAEGDYIIQYRDDIDLVLPYSDSSDQIDLGLGMKLVSAEEALALQEAGYLAICEPDVEMTYYDYPAPNDPYYKGQWNLPIIKATYPWSKNYFGNDVLVGIIDSGLAPNHPDIDYTRVIDGYNFGAMQSDSDYETNRWDTTDTRGHGTFCTGIIAAKHNNGIGISGISDKIKILPLKVASKSGSFYISSVINAINAGVAAGCDVLNISLGSGSYYENLETAVTNAYNNGVIVICAAGNDTSSDPGDHVRYPAGCTGAISVGSTTTYYTRAESSVTNESIFISAPADSVYSLNIPSGYKYGGGTSFAAPQIAAAAAIAKQIYPDITPAQFKDALQYSAQDLNPTVEGRDQEFGYGLLNLADMTRYVEALKNKTVYISSFDQRPKNIRIRNLSSSDFVATSIFTARNNNAMCYIDGVPLTLSPNQAYTHTLSVTGDHTNIAHFLWSSIKSATPLANYPTQRLTKVTN